jgi:outer membrane protein assembly factor BamB
VHTGRLRFGQFGIVAATLVPSIALMSACGDNGDSRDSRAESPPPDAMCADGLVPQAAAFDVDDGSFRWASCAEGAAYRYVRAVTDDAVYVLRSDGAGGGEVVALDPTDGSVVTDAPEPPPVEPGPPGPVVVDGLTVNGGQDDPVTVRDADGAELWSQPGVWTYDDVAAIDDGAVFAFERDESRLVAYELLTGDIRWEYPGDPYAEGLWPWHAADGRVFTAWDNLQVRDTGSGELLWTTSYPPSQHTVWRIAGVAADDDAVYVGFGTEASGGD